jgi:hypothetical protein
MENESKHIEHLTEEELAFYAEQLSSGTLEKVSEHTREHVAQCDECAKEALAIFDILNMDMDTGDQATLKSPKSRKKIFSSLAIAAGIAIIIGLFFIIQEKAGTTQEAKPTKLAEKKKEQAPVLIEENKHDTYPQDKVSGQTEKSSLVFGKEEEEEEERKTNYIAENYEPDPRLEKLTERFARGTFRDAEMEIKTPSSIEAKQGQPIILQWENPGKENLILELFDNKGKQVEEIELSGEKYTLSPERAAGLYYWKLMNMDFDLLFCGKIRVLIPE